MTSLTSSQSPERWQRPTGRTGLVVPDGGPPSLLSQHLPVLDARSSPSQPIQISSPSGTINLAYDYEDRVTSLTPIAAKCVKGYTSNTKEGPLHAWTKPVTRDQPSDAAANWPWKNMDKRK
jgi:hypothetical protein